VDIQGMTIRPVMTFKSGAPSGVDASAAHTLPNCNTNALAPSQGIGDCLILIDSKFFPAAGAQAPAQAALVLKVLQGDKVTAGASQQPAQHTLGNFSGAAASCEGGMVPAARSRFHRPHPLQKRVRVAAHKRGLRAEARCLQVLASSPEAPLTLGAAPAHPTFVPAALGLLVTLPYRNVAPGEKVKVTVTAGVSGPLGISAFNIPIRWAGAGNRRPSSGGAGCVRGACRPLDDTPAPRLEQSLPGLPPPPCCRYSTSVLQYLYTNASALWVPPSESLQALPGAGLLQLAGNARAPGQPDNLYRGSSVALLDIYFQVGGAKRQGGWQPCAS
jgi:hypothetical protein